MARYMRAQELWPRKSQKNAHPCEMAAAWLHPAQCCTAVDGMRFARDCGHSARAHDACTQYCTWRAQGGRGRFLRARPLVHGVCGGGRT